MSINKINGIASDTLSKVNGTNDALLCNMLQGGLNNANAPMFNSHSIDLNGSSNWLDLDAVVAGMAMTAGAVTLWFKIDTDATCILWKCNASSSASNNLAQIYYNAGSNKIIFQQIYSGTTKTYTTTAALTAGDDSWHFVAMSWSAENFYAYLDTEASGEQAPSEPGEAFTAAKCAAGKNSLASGTAYYFPGHINEISMWDAQLDADAIAAVYNGGKGINLTRDVGNYDNASDLIGYWKMEENTGTTVVDSSGNGETGTLSHSSLFSTDTI